MTTTVEQRIEAAKDNAVLQAQIWAQEAHSQRSTVLGILRHFGLPDHDWEALRLIRDDLLSRPNKVRELRDVQGLPGNCDSNPYMRGLYNGLELALSVMEVRDPVFKFGDAALEQATRLYEAGPDQSVSAESSDADTH